MGFKMLMPGIPADRVAGVGEAPAGHSQGVMHVAEKSRGGEAGLFLLTLLNKALSGTIWSSAMRSG